MHTILQDLRHGVRLMMKQPAFTLVVLVTLSLVIAANTAIFTVVNSVLLRPLPYAAPERLAVVWEAKPSLGVKRENVSPANFADFRDHSRSFDQMAAAYYWSPTLTGGERAEQLWGLRASASLFPLLGIQPQLGRGFLPGEDGAGRGNVVVLGHSLWQRRFGGDPDVLGRVLTLDGNALTVIGVMPPQFRFPPFWATRAELWAPLGFDEGQWKSRNARMLRVFARLKEGVSVERAQAELSNIAARLGEDYPEANAGLSADVLLLKEMVAGDIRPALLLLQVAAGFLLLIAAANLTNLFLNRSIDRRKEFAVRIALGAERGRLLRQLAVENLLLGAGGGLIGLLLSGWLVDSLLALLPAESRFTLPRLAEISIDGRVFAFTLLASILTVSFSTVFPAWRTWGKALPESLKHQQRSVAGGHQRFRSALVVVQVALSLLMLIGAGLLGKSLVRLLQIDPGFDPGHVLTMSISTQDVDRSEAAVRRPALYREIIQAVESLAGVEGAGATNHLPLVGDRWGLSFAVEGEPPPSPGRVPNSTWRVADPNYFAAMRIPLRAGRYFSDSDHERAPGVVLVNEAWVQRYSPNEDALGKRVKLGDPSAESPWRTIVGVIQNVKQEEWAEEAPPELYVPMAQNHLWPMTRYMTLVVRSSGDPSALLPAIRERISSIHRNAAVYDVLPMVEAASQAITLPRLLSVLVAVFAAMAVTLAAVAMYGVIGNAVSARTPELAIRMALGAQTRDVLALVLRRGLGLIASGVAIGSASGVALSRLMSGLMHGVSPTDPAIFAVSALFLILVGLLAGYLPARRVTKIEPVAALRSE